MNGRRCQVVTLIAVVAATVPLAAQRQTVESAAALERWVAAVDGHTPGKPDASIEYATSIAYSGRVDLHTAYLLFIRVLRDETVVARSDMDTNVIEQARKVRTNPGPAAFLKRAAVLHTDALIFADRFPAPKDDAPAPLPRVVRETVDGFTSVARRTDAVPPLLLNEWITLTRDGELVGSTKADWKIPFARSLLDVLLRLPVEGSEKPAAFVGEWYHAVAAFLFARGDFADAGPHLEHGARVLPDNPHVLFDLGTGAETYGLPVYQVVFDDPAVRKPGMRAGLPSENKTNADAERAYRRTIAVDPAYVEAHVRLARLLERRGQIDEAASHIDSALAAKPTGVPGFYAYLIAGRIASTRGRFDEALHHYRSALGLYAHAQSALLGASHAALMGADLPAALKPLVQLARDETPDADPWLDYQLGAGRDSTALLEALWRRVARQ